MGMLLEICDLSYQHPDGTKALDKICLQVKDNENLAIFGPNGSGKTTLLLHLNGTLTGRGSIYVAGLEVNKQNLAAIRRRVGIVFQDTDEQLFMATVLEDVMFGPLNLDWPSDTAEQRARRALKAVGIGEELLLRAPFHLSAGEKRRVALAGVLAMEPQLLLLDEPTTALDPPGQRALLDLLRSLPEPKIVATHDVRFAAALSNRAIFLENGRVIADGEVQEIARQFAWDLYS
ncbi:MAG: ATP-binding cassette domain-containing protein [Acidobacteriaceae bacterium]|nr:ATP-binding cassette domain-containing protein [Acidobacteriaceae bacterium]